MDFLACLQEIIKPGRAGVDENAERELEPNRKRAKRKSLEKRSKELDKERAGCGGYMGIE